MTVINAYIMNPAEDTILYGSDIREGMLVLPESETVRYMGGSEDQQLRAERFWRVTRLGRRLDMITFIGEQVDGFQRGWTVLDTNTWIVKRASIPDEPS